MEGFNVKKSTKIEITTEDIVESNLHLINSFVMEASMTNKNKKRIKSLALAYINIGKTLNLLGLDPSELQN